MWSLSLSFYFTIAPDVFCVFIDARKARICWKDPTHGQYVQSYKLLIAIDGRNVSSSQVPIFGSREEVCTSVYGTRLQETYNFTVRVHNGSEWSPDSVKRSMMVSREGKLQASVVIFITLFIFFLSP